VWIEEPAILSATLTAASAALGTVGTMVYKLKKARILADRDTRLAELAFENSKPCHRAEILDGLAKLRPFHPDSLEPEDADGQPVRGVLEKLPAALRRPQP
jgi:hypothetical protein